MIEEIKKLKQEKGITILAHNYQIPEIQDLADHTGDSLQLARTSQKIQGDIVFCGVKFMAETAKILSPEKRVFLPATDALCPMAQQLTPEMIRETKQANSDYKTVLYVNTTAACKAEADFVCTSANADKVCAAAGDKIIFGPDENLAHYVYTRTGKHMIVIPEHGGCIVHKKFIAEDVDAFREMHPGAKIVVHPECFPQVQEKADMVASTGGMLRDLPGDVVGIGTEVGMLHPLKKKYPEKTILPLNPAAVCVNMKKQTLETLLACLRDGVGEVFVPEDIAVRARKSIEAGLL